jgi:tetratricopeptide (TPR) repeat protein
MRVEGVNALNRALIFGFGKNGKFTDAAVHFTNAGNAYRRANEWQAAGDCFVRASEAHEELNEISNTIGMLIEAAHCYRHVNPTDCVGAYRKAIDLSKVQGNYIAASWYCKSMAEVFEQDNDDEMALTAFEEADKLYEKVGNKDYDCAVKVARYSAEFGDLTRAASIFEAIAKEGVLSRSCSARNYCFYSLLCYLAMGDHLHVRRKIAQCKNVDFTFGSSREGQFIEAILQVLPGMHSYYVLLCFHSTLCCPWCAKYSNCSCAFYQACEESSLQEFTAACAEYSHVSPLDNWQTHLLLRAKRCLAEQLGVHVSNSGLLEPDAEPVEATASGDSGTYSNVGLTLSEAGTGREGSNMRMM